MHIAFFLPDLRGGGAQKMMINMANVFAGRGHHVSLLISENEGVYHPLLNKEVNLVNFNRSRSLFSIVDLSEFIKNKKPDILISALFHVNLIAIVARFLAFKNKDTKLVITERNHLSSRVKGSTNLRDKFVPMAIRFLYPCADAIVGISNGVSEDLKKHIKNAKDKITTIYNPVVSSALIAKSTEDIKDAILDGLDVPLIVASGRLVPQKDYLTLFRALHEALKKRDMRLLILGDGHLESELKVRARDLKIDDKIIFKGFVENPLAYMKKADVFVISSAWEGFGNVIVEALLCGLKIVATDCPSGPSEILDNGRFGKLVPVGDGMKLAEKILEALDEKTDKEFLIKRAHDFNAEKICDEYMMLFESIMKRSSAS